MSALSGKDGKVLVGASEVCEIRNWSFTKTASNPSYAGNMTAGHKVSVPGVKSGSGSFGYVLHPSQPVTDLFDEGDEVTLKLYVDSTHFYTVPAVIDAIGVAVDVDDTAEVVGGPVEFTASGAWTKPDYTS